MQLPNGGHVVDFRNVNRSVERLVDDIVKIAGRRWVTLARYPAVGDGRAVNDDDKGIPK